MSKSIETNAKKLSKATSNSDSIDIFEAGIVSFRLELKTASEIFWIEEIHLRKRARRVKNADLCVCVRNCSAITNHINDTDVYKRLIMKYNDINGRQRDWTGMSPDTRTDIIAKFTNVVIA